MISVHYAVFYYMKKIVSISLVAIGVVALVMGGVFFFDGEKENPAPSIALVATSTPRSVDTTIIAFGDSLTAGYGLPLSESYPAQLESALLEKRYKVKVINAGVSGETTKGNSERALFIASQNADIVILGIGGNDALRALSVSETEKNIRETISTLLKASSSPEVILLQMQAPLNVGSEYKNSFDALYLKLAKEFSLPLVPLITESLFRKQYLLPDGIHLTKEGYGIFAKEILLPQLEMYLKGR